MELVYIVVPVFNEAPNIPTLFAGFRELEGELSSRYRVEYVLVDDGSSDGTVAAARREAGPLPLTVLEHGHNRGPGAAFATCFAYLAPRLSPQTNSPETIKRPAR